MMAQIEVPLEPGVTLESKGLMYPDVISKGPHNDPRAHCGYKT